MPKISLEIDESGLSFLARLLGLNLDESMVDVGEDDDEEE